MDPHTAAVHGHSHFGADILLHECDSAPIELDPLSGLLVETAEEGTRSAADHYWLRLRRVQTLSADDLKRWVDLEDRAAEPNAYLSPYFILPALKHLDPTREVLLIWIERRHAEGQPLLVGLGVFESMRASAAVPFRHLRGYLSRHSYLGGLLLDRDALVPALKTLYQYLAKSQAHRQGLVLPKMRCNGPVAQACHALAHERGLRRVWKDCRPRSFMRPIEAGPARAEQVLGGKAKEMRRCERRLADIGPVTWACHRGEVTDAAIERFLTLEHQGWKAQGGSSLLSRAADAAFFREAMVGFRRAGQIGRASCRERVS
jgi:hypothetical protein